MNCNYFSKIGTIIDQYELEFQRKQDTHFLIRVSVPALVSEKEVLPTFFKDYEAEIIFCLDTKFYLLYYPNKSYEFLEKYRNSYNLVCSSLSSNLSLNLQTYVECDIIEFPSDILCLGYFNLLQQKQAQNLFIKQSKSKITEEECERLTYGELVKKLEEFGTNWDSILSSEKFGTFYKRQGKKVHKICEKIDGTIYDKYLNFLFKNVE